MKRLDKMAHIRPRLLNRHSKEQKDNIVEIYAN